MEEEQQKDEMVEEKSLLQRTEEVVSLQKAENDRTAQLVVRMEKAKVTQMLGGTADAGQAPVPTKKLNDVEYAEAFEKGEVNPFKEDKVAGY